MKGLILERGEVWISPLRFRPAFFVKIKLLCGQPGMYETWLGREEAEKLRDWLTAWLDEVPADEADEVG